MNILDTLVELDSATGILTPIHQNLLRKKYWLEQYGDKETADKITEENIRDYIDYVKRTSDN